MKATLLVSTRPSVRRSSGTRPRPALHRRDAAMRGAKGSPSSVMRAAIGPVGAVDQPHQLGAPGADQAAKAEHFALDAGRS